METLNLGGLALELVSVAGRYTTVALPDWGALFDCGACPPRPQRYATAFLSHAHPDHAAGLWSLAGQRALLGAGPTRVVAPCPVKGDVDALLAAAQRLNGADDLGVEAATLDGSFPLAPDLFVRAVPTVHRVPSQGYVAYRRTKRLRPEFAGLAGAELGALRRAGATLDAHADVPVFAYSGDTTLAALPDGCDLLRARVLVLECTYVDADVSVAHARARGHVHLDDVLERADSITAEHVVLTHFSARYDPLDVVGGLRRLPADLRDRVVAVVGSDARRVTVDRHGTFAVAQTGDAVRR